MSASTRSSSKHAPFTQADDVRKDPALSAARASHRLPAPNPPPKTLTKNGFVNSGALAAATRAGTGLNTPANATAEYTNGATRRPSVDRPLVGSRNGSMTSLLPSAASNIFDQATTASPSFRQASPSHIAAVRAAERSATRSASNVLKATRESPPRRTRSPERKDERPIPATNKLVELFEARSKAGEDDIKPMTDAGPPIVLSPKPIRAASIKSITERMPSQPSKALASPSPSPRTNERQAGMAARSQLQPVQHQENASAISKAKPITPSPSRALVELRLNDKEPVSRASAQTGSRGAQKYKPRSISLDRAMPAEKQTLVASPLGSPVGRPSLRPSPSDRSLTTEMAVPQGGRREMSRPRSSYHPKKLQPQLNVNALANAMVASSLASSRAPSPHSHVSPDPYQFRPPLPPPRRSGKTATMGFLYSHHSGPPKLSPRPPSPNKSTLKQTLRKQPTGPEEEKRGRPAMHEGRGGKLRKHVGLSARPSTMDRVDGADRKLYEGVWAANRGILALEEEPHTRSSPSRGQRPKAADEVHGLVVRDIWKRSGLDDGLLEQIWDLVDGAEGAKRSTAGCLDRVEFVVGMWLVDQALMGRKLPRRLPESVWESVRVGPALTFRR